MTPGAAPRRLLDLLPAIYREDGVGDDAGAGDLAALLGVFEALFFEDATAGPARLPGIAARLDALPALFAPLGPDAGAGDAHGSGDRDGGRGGDEDEGEGEDDGIGTGDGTGDPDPDPDAAARTPARFLPWLAGWLAFAPREPLEPWRLRRVVAGIVPLHGRRGTRAHLEALLTLCFEEIAAVRIDERGHAGLRVGSSRLGTDSLLVEEQPFCFGVDVDLHPDRAGAAPRERERLERQVRAVIDVARPAHTVYELRLHAARGGARAPP